MTRMRKDSWAIRLAPGSERAPILAAIEGLDQAAREGAREIPDLWPIHSGGRSTIYGSRTAGENICLKVFTDRRLQSRLRTFFGWSKGRRAFRNGLRAHETGEPVPRVYAYAEKRPCGPTLVVMELLENAVQMNLLLEERLSRGIDLATDPSFRGLAALFALFTRDLHARGIGHHDFSPRNVLVADPEGAARLQLIDLEDIAFGCSSRKFYSDIQHFHGKMARYVNAEVLKLFQGDFDKIYGKS